MSMANTLYKDWLTKNTLEYNIQYYLLYMKGFNTYLNTLKNSNNINNILIIDLINYNKDKLHKCTYEYKKYYDKKLNLKKLIPEDLDIVTLYHNLSDYLSLYNLKLINNSLLVYYIINPNIILNPNDKFIYDTIKIINDIILFGILNEIGIAKILSRSWKINNDEKDYIKKLLFKCSDMRTKEIYNVDEYNFIHDMEFYSKEELYDYLINHSIQEKRYDYLYDGHFSKYEFLVFYGDLDIWKKSWNPVPTDDLSDYTNNTSSEISGDSSKKTKFTTGSKKKQGNLKLNSGNNQKYNSYCPSVKEKMKAMDSDRYEYEYSLKNKEANKNPVSNIQLNITPCKDKTEKKSVVFKKSKLFKTRIDKELQKWNENKLILKNKGVVLKSHDYSKWVVVIDNVLNLSINLLNYPFKPPKCKISILKDIKCSSKKTLYLNNLVTNINNKLDELDLINLEWSPARTIESICNIILEMINDYSILKGSHIPLIKFRKLAKKIKNKHNPALLKFKKLSKKLLDKQIESDNNIKVDNSYLPLSEIFKDQKKLWKCSNCWILNHPNDKSCIACNRHRDLSSAIEDNYTKILVRK